MCGNMTFDGGRRSRGENSEHLAHCGQLRTQDACGRGEVDAEDKCPIARIWPLAGQNIPFDGFVTAEILTLLAGMEIVTRIKKEFFKKSATKVRLFTTKH